MNVAYYSQWELHLNSQFGHALILLSFPLLTLSLGLGKSEHSGFVYDFPLYGGSNQCLCRELRFNISILSLVKDPPKHSHNKLFFDN